MNLNWSDKLTDFYLANPIICDVALVIILLLAEYFGESLLIELNIPRVNALDKSTALNYLSSIISTVVSLTGFMVAALTIMITVKASLKARGFNDSANALEYIFTTDRYHEIVGVFTRAILELIVVLVGSYAVWLLASTIRDLEILSKFLFCATFITSTAIVRSLYILFRVLKLERVKKPNKNTVEESHDEKQTRLLQEILEKLPEKNPTP